MYLFTIVDVNDKIMTCITNLFANAMSALCKVCLKSYKKPSSVLIV